MSELFRYIMSVLFNWQYIAYLDNPTYRKNEWSIYRLYCTKHGDNYIKAEYGRIIFIKNVDQEKWELI